MAEKIEKNHRPGVQVVAYVALGSNLGNRQSYIKKAIKKIDHLNGINVTKISPIYETEPEGGPPQGKYLNAVIEINCNLSPQQLFLSLQRIEKELGRTRKGKNYPRTIDLDILLFGDIIIEDETLKIPHPRMNQRQFVLKPLVDIAPDVIHPGINLSAQTLLNNLKK